MPGWNKSLQETIWLHYQQCTRSVKRYWVQF